MENSEQKILGLFFTYGTSVEIWNAGGMLQREKKLYEKFLDDQFFTTIYWYTYSGDDTHYQPHLRRGIIIVPKPKFFNIPFGNLLYSFLMPVVQRSTLRQCSIFKTNQMWGSWSAIISKWLFKKPLYVRTGFTASKFFKRQGKKVSYYLARFVESVAYRNASAASVTSEADRGYVTKKYSCRNVTIVPNFVDTELFKNFNSSKDKDLVYIGRLDEQKNLFNVLKALKNTKYQLDIYGSGELKSQLQEYAKEIKIQVNFYNPVPNNKLPEILNQYKIFLLCSHYEGMPKTLIEAMACGLACIGTDVEGISSIIENDKNGILVDTNSKAIHHAIENLIQNENLRIRLGSVAQKNATTLFSFITISRMEKKLINM